MERPVTPASLAFASWEFLRLIEGIGLIGSWGWSFADDAHVWSPGFRRLLGLESEAVRPGYDVFCALIHPEERLAADTAAQIRAGQGRDATLRVMRPDGSLRVLSCHVETYYAPDGRPRGAAGTVLDVTERDGLARIQAAERARRRMLFEQARCAMLFRSAAGAVYPSAEFVELTGIPTNAIVIDPFQVVAPDERTYIREHTVEEATKGLPYRAAPLAVKAGGGYERRPFLTVPVRTEGGDIAEWIIFVRPPDVGYTLSGRIREGLEQAVATHHLRAARALLGWSMMDLAAASGLSFSTVRRLEEGGEGAASRSRHVAVAALRRAGIRFSLLDGGTLAVGKA